MAKRVINRLKVILVYQGRINKWLAKKLGKNTTTVSPWLTNKIQPTMESLFHIAKVLDFDVRELLVSTK